MDTRGQGGAFLPGDTPDPISDPVDPQFPGFMTRGVLDPESYYYRRLITDAVRAVDAVRLAPGVDPSRVAVGGGSQGGGLALAVAGLASGVSAAAMAVQRARRRADPPGGRATAVPARHARVRRLTAPP